MPFNAPYTPAGDDLITAQGLMDNTDALQLYVNQGIDITDLETHIFDTEHIIEGEPFGVVPGHQFISGDQHRIYVSSDQANRTYLTGTDKGVDDLTDTTRWVIVPNTGKSFTAEANGFLFYHAWIMLIVPAESLGASTTVDPTIQVRAAIGVSGIYDDIWTDEGLLPIARSTDFFIEDSAYTATGSGFTNGTAQASPANRRYFPVHYEHSFSKGESVRIGVLADCRTERAYVSARSVYIETFYL